MKRNDKKESKNWLKLLIFFILGGFLVKIFASLFKKRKLDLGDIKDNLDDFIKKEEKEVEELTTGKETFKKYCRDSAGIFKDYFIPHDGNEHKPKILRAKPLLIIVIFSILLKAGVLGYLFFIYPNTAKMQQQITAEILILTNQDRQDNNLPGFEINPVLSSAAQAKANDMIASDYFSHYGPDGKKPWDWVDREQYAYLYIGENLAMNFSSADSAHLALMQSPSHKKNILNDNYQDIGLAVVSGEINGKNTTVLVELFGSRKKIAPATIAKIADKINITPRETVETEIEVLASEKIQPEAKANTATEMENKNTIEASEINETAGEEINGTKVKAEDSQASIIAQVEPESDLNQEILYVAQQKSRKIGLATTLIIFSKYFYAVMLIATIIILLINIFVRISIQHKPVIMQSLLVILFLAGLLFIKFHILEGLIEKIIII